jgi:Methylamine utilisation protein MauE
VVAVAQWFLAVVFAGAAATKLSDRERFLRTLIAIPWLSLRRARFASVGTPSLELLVAGVLAVFPVVGAAAGLAALCLFTGVILVELLAGREFRCGCFGGADGRPAGRWTIIRNAALAAAAGFIIAFPAEPEIAAALVGVGIGLMFVLFEVGVETLMVARAR